MLISAWILAAVVDLELIHALLSVSPVIEEINSESSLSSNRFWVEFRCFSLSSSSTMILVVLSCLSLFKILYHFVQLVSVVTRDRLDEILVSSFGSCSHDMQNFWEASDRKYIFYPPIRP